MDENPELAYEHAKAAYRRASRIDIVREALGLTAYANEKYGEALRELRTYRRMSGDLSHAYLEADCERGMGKPDRAVKYLEDIDIQELEPAAQVELALVVSGAYSDMIESETGLKLIETLKVDYFKDELRAPVEQVRYERLRELGRDEEASAVEARWSPLWDAETIEVFAEAIEEDDYTEDSDDSYGEGEWDDSSDSADSVDSVSSADDWDDDEPVRTNRFADFESSSDDDSDVEDDSEDDESEDVLDDESDDLLDKVDQLDELDEDDEDDDEAELIGDIDPEGFIAEEEAREDDVLEAQEEIAEELGTGEFADDEANVSEDEVLDDVEFDEALLPADAVEVVNDPAQADDVISGSDEDESEEEADDDLDAASDETVGVVDSDSLMLPGLEDVAGESEPQDDLFAQLDDEGETK
ncbi:MAG: hypothetical protein QMB98_08020 [Flaviflexus sp.]|uniref:hypothetical protein n=1 Tax=Flaviflexus sp. TaxID=1969482 RepID=UPI00352FA862